MVPHSHKHLALSPVHTLAIFCWYLQAIQRNECNPQIVAAQKQTGIPPPSSSHGVWLRKYGVYREDLVQQTSLTFSPCLYSKRYTASLIPRNTSWLSFIFFASTCCRACFPWANPGKENHPDWLRNSFTSGGYTVLITTSQKAKLLQYKLHMLLKLLW